MTNQTLTEWASQAQITVEVHRSGARFIYRPCNLPSNWTDLWHLVDYGVSSQTGSIIWLSQRSPSDSKPNQCCFCEQPLIIPKDGDDPKVWRRYRDVVGFTKGQVIGDHDGEDYGPFNTTHHGSTPADLSAFDKVFCHACAQALWWELESGQMITGGIQLKSLEAGFNDNDEFDIALLKGDKKESHNV